MLSETEEVVAHLSPSYLHPERSRFIVLELIWPSSGTFQHHHQLNSADTTPCLLGRLDSHQCAANFECVLRTSLKSFETRFFTEARSSGVFMERPRSLEQQSASAAEYLLGNKSELSHLNDGTASVRVSHYTQCIAA